MRQLITGAFIACMVLASCKKDKHKGTQLSGTYKGIFYRESVIKYDTSQVLLNFTGNKFTGASSKDLYPAICNGTFSVNNNKATFTNACFWTANFDWSFILNNEYEISIKGDTLRIERGYDGVIFSADRYVLVKQH